MTTAKRKFSVDGTFDAVFENGVFKPLQPLHLKERSRVKLSLCRGTEWRRDFERLLRRMKLRTRSIPRSQIEKEITQARAEVKARRRAARRLA
jgi:predicted DNA-binding antitoxin AbrB/MazE fold protein